MKPIVACMAVVLLATGVQLLQVHKACTVDEIYRAANITPNVYPTSPLSILQLSYLSFGTYEVAIGSEVCPANAINPPILGFEYKVDTYYTVIMLGLDEPSPDCPFLSQYIMALYVNIYASADGITAEQSCEIVTYIPPNPPPGFGKHRFAIYVFEQNGIIDGSNAEFRSLQLNRFGFLLKEFESVTPVAGTFFYVQYPLFCSCCG